MTARAIRIAFMVASEPLVQNATRSAFGNELLEHLRDLDLELGRRREVEPELGRLLDGVHLGVGAWPLIRTP